MPVVLPRYLYLTADRNRIVEEGDLLASFVLGGPGSTIPDDEAERLGLEEYLNPKPKDTKPLVEPKAVEPPANKAKRPGKNK